MENLSEDMDLKTSKKLKGGMLCTITLNLDFRLEKW